ncbi:MAG: hypothetical protein ABI556_11125 [Gemmatimonadales bacterium]
MTTPLPLEPAEPPPPPTGRRWGVIAFILLLILLAPASWLARKGATKLEFFHLRSIAVEGTRYLSPEKSSSGSRSIRCARCGMIRSHLSRG